MNDSPVIEAAPSVDELNYDSNLILGLIAGGIAMLISAIIWGIITYVTEYQISFMAIGVGFFVGIAIQKFGKGDSLIFGISGAILSFLGCVLGNFLFYNGVIAKEWEVPFFELLFALSLDPTAMIEIFSATLDIMDLLFYGIAAYIGYKTALGTAAQKQFQLNK